MTAPLREQVLEKIANEEMHPTPRWWFVVREAMVWSALVITGLLAGVSIGLATYRLRTSDVFDMYGAGVPWYQLLLVVGWIGAFVCLFLLLLYEVRCTKRGYRFSLVAIASTGSLIVIGIASVIYTTGVVHTTERYMARMMPTYIDAPSAREQFWSSPNEGRLMGYIVAADTPRVDGGAERSLLQDHTPQIYIEDMYAHRWVIVVDPLLTDAVDTPIGATPTFGLFVGQRSGDATFTACGMALYEHGMEKMTEQHTRIRPLEGRERLVSAVRTKKCTPKRIDAWRRETTPIEI